jgi:ATP-dependent protease HslVU (ClpYQ) ATPase subunit
LKFEDDDITDIAWIAALVNQVVENIGARRLQPVTEPIME